MKLYLAVAVLMLALVAQTEAQDDPTIEEHFSNFGTQMTEMGRDVAAKAKGVFENINTSEFARTTKDWFQEQFQAVKAKIEEMSQK